MKCCKPILSGLLLLSFCFSLILAFAPNVFATDISSGDSEEIHEIKLDVTYLESNYDEWQGGNLNNFFTEPGIYEVKTELNKPAYIIGRLAEPSTISHIELPYVSNLTRARGSRVFASTDGQNWEQIGSFPHPMNGQDTTLYRLDMVNTSLRYSYIKIEQDPSLAQWMYTLSGISVYTTIYTDGSEICDVTFEHYTGGYYNDAISNDNAARVFTHGNSLVWNSADQTEAGVSSVVGAFAEDTQITHVRLVTHPVYFDRLEQAVVEGSKDGTEWKVLTTVSGMESDTITLNVDNEESFNYIRIRSGKKGIFSLKNVTVYGFSVTPVFRAYQETVPANGTQSVRLIATLNTLNYSEIGFHVSATYTDPDTNESKTVSIDRSCAYAYHSLTASEADGTVDTVTAEELGGVYLYALVIHGVPTDVGELVFTVTPYAVQGEDKLVGETAYVTYQNGVAVVPEA